MKKTYFTESQKLRRRIEGLLPDFYEEIFYENTETAELISHYIDRDKGAKLPDNLGYNFTYDHYTIEAADLSKEDMAGSFTFRLSTPGIYTLEIDENFLEDDSVIEHELIHLHEQILNELQASCYRDICLICLYRRVNKLIPGLEDLLRAEARRENVTALTGWDYHGIFFTLKSYELDIKHGRELGRTRGYNRQGVVENIRMYQDMKAVTGYNYSALR